MHFILSAIIAYLLGSINCAILVAKVFKQPDPRTQGSGNAGATNVMRIGGTKAGAIVLVGDALKGLLAIIIALLLNVDGVSLGFVALVVVVGHIFPIFFGFKGGKGVATAGGALLGISPITLVFAAVTWGLITFVTRYVSLASMLSVVVVPFYLLIGGNYVFFIPFVLIAILIVWKHKDNIQRLRSGTENKINFK